MKWLTVVFVSTVLGLSSQVMAGDKSAEIKLINERVKQELKRDASSIKESPIAGLYEVLVGSQVFYFYKDGRYVISGDLFDMKKGKNLTQAARSEAQMAELKVKKPENIEALNKMGEKNMIVYAPTGKVKHTITVFTDIDCGYCRKLHNEMADYNKLGIKVRYLAYPRAGEGSGSYHKAVSVWCANDQRKAMDTAKSGGNLPSKQCDNPVKAHLDLGHQMGVNGTPALVLENGQLYPGYAPADKLIALLDGLKRTK